MLSQTQRMKSATMEYIQEENLAEMFIDERCRHGGPNMTLFPSGIFYREFSTYLPKERIRHPTPSQSIVGKQVKALNYGLGRAHGSRDSIRHANGSLVVSQHRNHRANWITCSSNN